VAPSPDAHAVRSFLVSPVIAAIFVLAKLVGVDERPWNAVLSAALAAAALVVTGRLIAISRKASR
jgi:hypothetical protein